MLTYEPYAENNDFLDRPAPFEHLGLFGYVAKSRNLRGPLNLIRGFETTSIQQINELTKSFTQNRRLGVLKDPAGKRHIFPSSVAGYCGGRALW